MNQIITDNLPAIQTICEQFGVARLELFGSATRDDFDPEKSDFDFIVEFLDYGTGISDRFFGLIEALEELLGHPVDLGSARTLKNPYLIAEINQDRTTLYDAGNRSAAA
ncbi:MAG TPA: nucleotidyltransferase domain-containing protein [Thermomicrobiales bacterium]|nr:nucleotidyltransferase domain-containing protein [Thermomicrobiales bacterium]